MGKLIFCNVQGLSGNNNSGRLAFISQLLAEERVSVAFLCEVMISSKNISKRETLKHLQTRDTRNSARTVEAYDRNFAQWIAHNESLRSLIHNFYPAYKAEHITRKQDERHLKNYWSISEEVLTIKREDKIFTENSTRIPIRWTTKDGVSIYIIHAISNHNAARKQLEQLIKKMQELHGESPWIILGDLNCPPKNLQSKCEQTEESTAFPLPQMGLPTVFACVPEGATRWKSGNILDYAISNIPCKVTRLPRCANPEDLLNSYSIDHRPILIEYINAASVNRSSSGNLVSSLPFPNRPASNIPGYIYRCVPGDGNCLFHAVAVASGIPNVDASIMRAGCVDYILKNWERYQGFVDGSRVANLTINGEWGGEEALVALAQKYRLKICVHRFDRSKYVFEPLEIPFKEIHLYFTGDHYDVLIPDVLIPDVLIPDVLIGRKRMQPAIGQPKSKKRRVSPPPPKARGLWTWKIDET